MGHYWRQDPRRAHHGGIPNPRFGHSCLYPGAPYQPGRGAAHVAFVIFGVAAFTAMGLLLGGTLSSEVVLALANLIWFLLLGVVGWTLYSQGLGDNGILNAVPTVALAGALTDASNSVFPGLELLSLLAWLAVASFAAVRWFRFDG